ATGRGPRALRQFLAYAESGDVRQSRADSTRADGLTQELESVLRKAGFETEAHVGVAGVFVDVAVRNPDVPSEFLLGIESDGREYADCPSARDRDRLRPQILKNQDWQVHRIWAADWFFRGEAEVRRLMGALKRAQFGEEVSD